MVRFILYLPKLSLLEKELLAFFGFSDTLMGKEQLVINFGKPGFSRSSNSNNMHLISGMSEYFLKSQFAAT